MIIRPLFPSPPPVHSHEVEHSRFAGLAYDTPTPYVHGGLYYSKNKTLTDEAWKAINYDHGSVALSDEDAAAWGLPVAQRFPWDQTKGLYFLSGYHSLHCLKTVRQTIVELRDGQALSIDLEHALHCLEGLRQDVICHADDTPRYTSFAHPGLSGVGQVRMCRDWSKLEAWSEAHHSCWRDIQPTGIDDTLLRYRYCPTGSPYQELVKAEFPDFEY
ncbi:hypothetical protein MMC19_002966 [Ptychographa xylographoides]|nr:hypothetical protein [Ptychographa xylographoides]